jgi:sugar phosphate isomerase/epimerase
VEAAKLSLNTATVRPQWNLRECVEGCLRHGLGGIAPWRDKLHEAGVAAGARMIKEAGLTVTGLCRGGWYTAEGALTQAVLDDNRRAVDEAAAIGAACLVMVVGGLPPGSKDIAEARAIVIEGLARTLEYARSAGVPIAIEPLHPMYAADRACINTTAQALDICDALGPGIGVALDVYHVWWDPELERQIERAGRDRLLAFHICDWLVPTRDLLLDRGMMGDGVIDIAGIWRSVAAQGFDGLREVEIFSAQDWWKRDPDEVLATLVKRGRHARGGQQVAAADDVRLSAEARDLRKRR